MCKLELLAPAKDLECGLAAINHGADAVYIGAERFSARAAVGNSIDDIKTLCDYAHQFGARVYVAVNTIIYDHELDDTRQLIIDMAGIGVDAIIVQDMATLQMLRDARSLSGNPIHLHASTQCDTRTPEKAGWLRKLGFSRVVLARELSLQEIRNIHQSHPDVELEAFVHGALCVSYSGVCYASQQCFARSANRGRCAQFCRMKFDLLDADGHLIEAGRHFLSLKDMCQINNLEAMADAGVGSFKIEGRLKDVGYVKNVVSAFSQELDKLIARHPEKYVRASFGRVSYGFTPNLCKTFNRGFTTYFLNERQPDIASFDTPKAIGEYVGKVKEIGHGSFTVSGTASFSNGDGLCFVNAEQELEGFRVNKAVGNRLYPLNLPWDLKPNTKLYRNSDEAFTKILSGNTAERKVAIKMYYGLTDTGFSLRLACRPNQFMAETSVSSHIIFPHQVAHNPQDENIRKQLSKLGNTPFYCVETEISEDASSYFVPSSLLVELRRAGIKALQDKLLEEHVKTLKQEQNQIVEAEPAPQAEAWHPTYRRFSYLYNVSNQGAHSFYASHGMAYAAPPPEIEAGRGEKLLMQCRHCLRFSMGYCLRYGGTKPTWREPLFLRLGDGRRFRLEFKCDECQMNVYSEK